MARPAGFEPATHALEGRCSFLTLSRVTYYYLPKQGIGAL